MNDLNDTNGKDLRKELSLIFNELQIPVIADLPVGENLQDHGTLVASYELDPNIQRFVGKLSNQSNVEQYIEKRTGPLTAAEGVTYLAFLNGLNVSPKVDRPTYQLYFGEAGTEIAKAEFGLKPEVYKQLIEPLEKKPFYICFSSLMQPKSRGTVKLNSSDPFDPPLIDPNYFEDSRDIDEAIKGLKVCNKIATSERMQKVGSKPSSTLMPGCEKLAKDEDKYLECVARSVVITLNHQVGTAKMGDPKDQTTVVDPQLRVKGIEGLRVVDASIMPIVPSGNTNIPTIMVAEKASDIIKETIKCRPYSPPEYSPKNDEL